MSKPVLFLCLVSLSVVLAKIDFNGFQIKQLINSPTVSPKVYKNAHPYLVSIRNASGYLCTGAFISDKYVLTAAHCFGKDKNPVASEFSVYYNSTKLGEQKELKVQELKIHSDYRHAHNDIALMLLKDSPKPAVTPVVISDQADIGNVPIQILAWGSTSAKPLRLSNDLRIFDGESITHENCGNEIRNLNNEEHMCYWGGIASDSATCRGDSGSPILYDGKLVGVNSVGTEECSPGDISVAARIAPKYLKWIKDNSK